MNWQSFPEFLAMGGRGFFVWGAYGISALLIAGEIILQARRHKQRLRQLRRLQQIEDQA
jgi:heme exporter protein D